MESYAAAVAGEPGGDRGGHIDEEIKVFGTEKADEDQIKADRLLVLNARKRLIMLLQAVDHTSSVSRGVIYLNHVQSS